MAEVVLSRGMALFGKRSPELQRHCIVATSKRGLTIFKRSRMCWNRCCEEKGKRKEPASENCFNRFRPDLPPPNKAAIITSAEPILVISMMAT